MVGDGTTATHEVFRDLVDRLLDRVYGYLRNLTRDGDVARDLTHEAFLKLQRRIALGERPADGYVFAAARNLALSRWRRHQVRRRVTTELEPDRLQAAAAAGADPGRQLERRQLRQDLEAALQALPEPLRSVFLLSEVEGLRQSEIAQIMDIAPGTVASRKFSAVRALRRELERRGHGLPGLP